MKASNICTLNLGAKCTQYNKTLTIGTRRQSAMELGFDSASAGSPALMASVKLGHISDSTACRVPYIPCV